MAFALFASSACASGPSLHVAVAAHSTTKHALEAIDADWAPRFEVDVTRGALAHPLNDNAYQAAIAPDVRVNTAINRVRQFEQLMHLAVSQLAAGADDGGMLAEIAPCGVEALSELDEALTHVPDCKVMRALVELVAVQVEQLAPGPCDPEVMPEVKL